MLKVAVDIIIWTGNGFVAIRRKNEPFKGEYALPGGFVELGETTEQAAIREAKEETGLDIWNLKLRGVYSEPGRDPRGDVISICYSAFGKGTLKAGDDAAKAEVISLRNIPNMAFDHNRMLYEAGFR